EFRAFAERHPGFRFVPCFSRELPAPGSAHAHADVRHGYVQQFLAEFAPDAQGDIAYLCGNPNMVDACFEALKEAGLPVPRIRREKYVSSKYPRGGQGDCGSAVMRAMGGGCHAISACSTCVPLAWTQRPISPAASSP